VTRYADGPSAWCQINVPAAPAEVWRLVADVGLPARFSPELVAARWLDGASGPAPGAVFEGHNRHPLLGEWRTHCHVLEAREPHAFVWAVVDPDDRFGGGTGDAAHPMAVWRYELASHDGGTLLRHGVRLGPARSGLSLAIDLHPEAEESIVARRLDNLQTAMRATLAGIAAVAAG